MDPLALQYRSPSKRVILGHLNNQNGNSPISPMANLKLLTKVATSDLGLIMDQVKLKRRDKSLSVLCNRFLDIFPLSVQPGACELISLGNLALKLSIEKRRVYDIINVVASLQMAVKVCKDKYQWFGNQNLQQFLYKLKKYALQNNMHNQVNAVIQGNTNEINHEDHCYDNSRIPKFSLYSEKLEDNRIGILCQKFVMLFLVIKEEGALNLSGIAKLILSDEQGKTGMRRLYDVANILETLGLIKRHGKIHKKPSFVYCGPKIEVLDQELLNESLTKFIRTLDFCDTSSEHSSDFPQRNMESMLEVVCTELEKFDDKPKAKRRLCLIPNSNIKPISIHNSTTFIKAPSQSFRFSCNQFTEKKQDEILNNNNIKSNSNRDSTPSEGNCCSKNNNKHAINQFSKPDNIIRPRIPIIQNGAIYRAENDGKFIKFVKL